MSDYWHKEYICPFWQAAGKKSIRCEGECASFDYPNCSIAGAKIRHYEKTE